MANRLLQRTLPFRNVPGAWGTPHTYAYWLR